MGTKAEPIPSHENIPLLQEPMHRLEADNCTFLNRNDFWNRNSLSLLLFLQM